MLLKHVFITLVFSTSCFFLASAQEPEIEEGFFTEEGDLSPPPEFQEEPLPQLGQDQPQDLDSEIEEAPLELDQEPIPTIKRKKEDIGQSYQYGPKKIYHPNAKKGLTKITKDKVYLYRTKRTEQNKASSLRFGMLDPTYLASNEADGPVFTDIYPDSQAPVLLYDYEWQLWQGFGKLGIKVGTGLYMTQGTGRFKNASIPARERFTFTVMPNNVSAVYRMQYWEKQFLVPFIEGGLDAFTFAEFREDKDLPKLGAALAGHYAGGAALSLTAFDSDSVFTLDSEYGINSVWLTVEFRGIIGFHQAFDFTSNVINGGIMVEF